MNDALSGNIAEKCARISAQGRYEPDLARPFRYLNGKVNASVLGSGDPKSDAIFLFSPFALNVNAQSLDFLIQSRDWYVEALRIMSVVSVAFSQHVYADMPISVFNGVDQARV